MAISAKKRCIFSLASKKSTYRPLVNCFAGNWAIDTDVNVHSQGWGNFNCLVEREKGVNRSKLWPHQRLRQLIRRVFKCILAKQNMCILMMATGPCLPRKWLQEVLLAVLLSQYKCDDHKLKSFQGYFFLLSYFCWLVQAAHRQATCSVLLTTPSLSIYSLKEIWSKIISIRLSRVFEHRCRRPQFSPQQKCFDFHWFFYSMLLRIIWTLFVDNIHHHLLQNRTMEWTADAASFYLITIPPLTIYATLVNRSMTGNCLFWDMWPEQTT